MKMNTSTHPIEQEEVMAYLDGELQSERATVVEGHMACCKECQELAVDLRRVSQGLKDWRVEPPEAGLFLPIGVAQAGQESASRRKPWFESYLISWGVAAAVCLVVVVGAIRLIGTNASTIFTPAAPQAIQATLERPESVARVPESPSARPHGSLPSNVKDKNAPPSEASGTSVLAPMIARTAALSITVQEFDKARSRLDEILVRHRGYLGGLQISTPSDHGRVLNGVLRVPVGQMDSALTELKSLGRVDAESQNGEEVTAQYVDLQARLANSRNTEQRLTDVLQQRTGKLSDVLEVETEIARVRGEIEGMEAERKSLATQVSFATLNVTLTEDYKPKLQTVPPTTFRQFRNSAVEGYQTMAGGVIALVNAELYYGPTILLWAALAFFPLRSVWPKVVARPSNTQRAAS
jgi:hypothetical protein